MDVFVSGGTGYLGRVFTARLAALGHQVCVLARTGSESKVPPACRAVPGDALDPASFAARVPRGSTFVHLVGVAHPAPWKGAQFRAVDLVALQASAQAALESGCRHFVYLSVAHPAPVMKSYIAVRRECERILGASGLVSTILRPWYVLGPGHRWPALLKPLYAAAERLPALRDGALRLGLVTREQMVAALCRAVNDPPSETRIFEVPDIRRVSFPR